jgi:COP9 signalosome complex subunit 7
VAKLKQLSIVTLASQASVVTYADLRTALDVQETRVLEDLVIETVYLGLLKAKIDQDSERVRVFDFLARDAKKEDLPEVLAALKKMRQRNDQVRATF